MLVKFTCMKLISMPRDSKRKGLINIMMKIFVPNPIPPGPFYCLILRNCGIFGWIMRHSPNRSTSRVIRQDAVAKGPTWWWASLITSSPTTTWARRCSNQQGKISKKYGRVKKRNRYTIRYNFGSTSTSPHAKATRGYVDHMAEVHGVSFLEETAPPDVHLLPPSGGRPHHKG